MKSKFVYVSLIKTTPTALWEALTTPKFMKQYWAGCYIKTEWKAGAAWTLLYDDGRIADSGEILEFDPPKRMVLKWQNEWKPELKAEGYSRCTMELEPEKEAVKLTITHVMERGDSKFIEAVSGGWPKVLSNLKSLLETGEIALSASR